MGFGCFFWFLDASYGVRVLTSLVFVSFLDGPHGFIGFLIFLKFVGVCKLLVCRLPGTSCIVDSAAIYIMVVKI
jgi:hypothetical protein